MNKSIYVVRCFKTVLTALLVMILSASLWEAQAKSPGFFQQQKTVKGKVTDEQNNPLPDVSIIQKGTTNGTVTSATGEYSLTVPDNAILVFTSIGFTQQEMPAGSSGTANLQLKALAQYLTDVVVVGYGTQKKVTVTGAVTSVKGENLIRSPAVDLSNSLAGR